jgi:hypothetical protein
MMAKQRKKVMVRERKKKRPGKEIASTKGREKKRFGRGEKESTPPNVL